MINDGCAVALRQHAMYPTNILIYFCIHFWVIITNVSIYI